MTRFVLGLLILTVTTAAAPGLVSGQAPGVGPEAVAAESTADSPVVASAALDAPATTGSVALSCLGREARRHAAETHKFVPLTRAIHSARRRVPGDVVKARLCRQGELYVYLLTVLARDGKVSRVSVNATTGRLVEAR